MTGFSIPLSDIRYVGTGLRRPEYALASASGDLYVAALGNGVVRIHPDGRQAPLGQVAEVDGEAFIPNGLARTRDGGFLISNMGRGGGLWRLGMDGKLSEALRQIDGLVLPATNFVLRDEWGRVWITVTTRLWPISQAFSPYGGPHVEDGFVAVIDERGARIVADGFAFTNELRVDAAGTHLYVVETQGRRITRFRIGPGNALSGREIFTTFDYGTFPDGIAFDQEDHLWVASLISNRVIRVAPDGSQSLVLADSDEAHIRLIEEGMRHGTIKREDMQRSPTRHLHNIASVTFGGPDLRTVYLGSLGGSSLASFRSPVAGRPLAHYYE